jgi:phage baseplate assembly protein W
MPNQAPLVGWPLLPLPDANGELRYPSLEDSVRQSIQVILRTQPGEQLMRPAFGAGLSRFLQEPNTLTTRRRIRDLIAESLENWERRVIVDRIEVVEVPEEPTHIRVEIAYRLRRTGAAQQIGLTMMLEG